MGLGTEMAIEYDAELAYWYAQQLSLLAKDLWLMEDGTMISVSDMRYQHIVNCIRMIEDRDDEISEMWLSRFKKELKDRSSGMQLNVTVCGDETLDDAPCFW